jgi:hypothetical protein
MSIRDADISIKLNDLTADERAIALRVVLAMRTAAPERRDSMVRAFVGGMEDMAQWRPARKPVSLRLVKGGQP